MENKKLLLESQDQNLALTVSNAPYSLERALKPTAVPASLREDPRVEHSLFNCQERRCQRDCPIRRIIAGSSPEALLRCSLFARKRVQGVPGHPGGNPGANLKSTAHRCYLREVAFEWALTKETIYLPLGCLQAGCRARRSAPAAVA